MFGFNFGEMLLLAAIALIAIGPKQLPEVARVVGRMLNEFKRATGDFQRTLSDMGNETTSAFTDVKKSIDKSLLPAANSIASFQQAKGPIMVDSEPEAQQSFHMDQNHYVPPAPEPIALDDANQMSFDLDSAKPEKKNES